MTNATIAVLVIVISAVAVLGWFSLSDYIKEASASHANGDAMNSYVDYSKPHCTASLPCHLVCGNHVCAPGEIPQPPKK